MLDRGIGIAGAALALIAIFAPYKYPKMPNWTVHVGLSVGVLLVGLAAGLIIADRRNDDEARQVLTDLKVEFFGDQRSPRELHIDNIATWYALWSPSAAVISKDSEGKEIARHLFPRTWNIFITFIRPANYRQIIVSLSGDDLPQYEVKQSSTKFAIVQINGDIPKGILDIYVQP